MVGPVVMVSFGGPSRLADGRSQPGSFRRFSSCRSFAGAIVSKVCQFVVCACHTEHGVPDLDAHEPSALPRTCVLP